MKAIILILTLIFSTQNLLAQVSLEFETRKSAEGDLKIYGSPAPFKARFRFEKEPSPLDTVVIHYSLEIVKEFPEADTAWQLKIGHQSQAVQLIGDSIIIWDGPHGIGDTYHGSLKLIPLMSGFQAIYIYREFARPLADVILRANGVSFEWCLDQDGNALFVGSYEGQPVDCNDMPVVFYNKNEVIFREADGDHGKGLFHFNGRLRSIPSIGDTVVLNFQLTTNIDLPRGYDLSATSDGMEIVSSLDYPNNYMSAGGLLEIELKLIPLPVRGPHRLSLHLVTPRPNARSQTFQFTLVFGEDGDLRYAYNGHVSIHPEILPKGYRPGTDADIMELQIKAITDR